MKNGEKISKNASSKNLQRNLFFFDLNCILLAARLVNGVVCILEKTRKSLFFVFNCCIVLAARLLNGVVCTENSFSRKTKKGKLRTVFSLALKQENQKLEKFIHSNSLVQINLG